MNPWFLGASILSYVLGIGHSVLGEWVGDRVLRVAREYRNALRELAK